MITNVILGVISTAIYVLLNAWVSALWCWLKGKK